MPYVLQSIAVSLMVATSSAAATDPLQRELRRLSGPGAIDCGLVALGAAADRGWSCAQAADHDARPFWFAIELKGVDSAVWEAVGRDATGQRYLLRYDSSPYGGLQLLPRYTRDTCAGPFSRSRGADAAFECERTAF